LQRSTTSLSTLNLGQNVLGDDGASKLKDGLLQNHSLLRLGLVGTKLTCEGEKRFFVAQVTGAKLNGPTTMTLEIQRNVILLFSSCEVA